MFRTKHIEPRTPNREPEPGSDCLGFARERSIAINPVNPMPHKTRFHELAQVLLGHTAEGEQADGEITPRSLLELAGWRRGVNAFGKARCIFWGPSPSSSGNGFGNGSQQAWSGHERKADDSVDHGPVFPVERLQRFERLSVPVAAGRLGVSRWTVKRWRRQVQLSRAVRDPSD